MREAVRSRGTRARAIIRTAAGLLAAMAAMAATMAAPCLAVTPYLVADINRSVSPASSDPRDFRRLAGLALFTATEGDSSAVWRSDGTEGGTFPVLPGCDNCFLRQDFSGAGNGRAFLSVVSAEGHPELWVTGGRPGNTFRLADFSPGSGATGSGLWVPEQGRLYFTADDGVHGLELWTSDGTPAGTNLVADLATHELYAPAGLTRYRGAVFFGTWDGAGYLWKSDGTARGTVPVKRFPGSRSQVRPQPLGVVGGRLLFSAYTGKQGIELWATDGTTGGTFLLADLAPGALSTLFGNQAKLGERLLFVADDGSGQNLWMTDGTSRRTRRLTGFRGSQAFGPFGGFLFLAGSRIFFAADDGRHGRELWVTDGTPAGTGPVRDVCPGHCAAEPIPLAVASGGLLFNAWDGVHGQELWATDGTPAGTRLVRDLCPGECASYPGPEGFVLGGAVLFKAIDADGLLQVWRSDGTEGGTVRLTSFTQPNLWILGFQGTVTPRLLLFTGEDAGHGRELWRSDGTEAGTFRVKDIATEDLGGSDPGALRAAGDRLLFFADDGSEKGLWRSDGSAAGTAKVVGFSPEAPLPPTFFPSVETGGTLFFLADADLRGYALWKSDGSAAGTARVTREALSPYGHTGMGALSGRVFFVADDGSHGPALWKTDGTEAGTVPVDPVGWSGGSALGLTVFAGRLYYLLLEAGASEQLWSTDGTREGTRQVADLHAVFSDFSGNLPLLAEAGGRLYFFAAEEDSPGKVRLWSTDGSEVGTRRVSTLGIAPADTFKPAVLAGAGGRIFVSGSVLADGAGGAAGPEPGLWVSDGTEAGTRRLGAVPVEQGVFEHQVPFDFAGRLAFAGPAAEPGVQTAWISDGTVAGTAPLLDPEGHEIPDPKSFCAFAGQLFFAGRGADGRVALWQSDGTPDGTRRVKTLGPSGSDYGNDLTVAGGRLFFKAYDPALGAELWALSPD